MDEQQWAAAEHEARLADLAAAKRGEMTLEQAQARARDRRRTAGLSRNAAARAVHEAGRDRRIAAAK